jgi:pimeloyl-ACP methyl ester carboxylesterase
MVTETDLELGDGRTLHTYDTGTNDANGRLAVFWHNGSPNIGAPPEPLFSVADRLGIRWVSYDRPGYGGSAPRPERDVASAAGAGRYRHRTRTSFGELADKLATPNFAEFLFHALG